MHPCRFRVRVREAGKKRAAGPQGQEEGAGPRGHGDCEERAAGIPPQGGMQHFLGPFFPFSPRSKKKHAIKKIQVSIPDGGQVGAHASKSGPRTLTLWGG